MPRQALTLTLAACLLFALLAPSTLAHREDEAASSDLTTSHSDSALQEIVNEAARAALERFKDKKLEESQLSITLIDLRDAQHPVQASFRGNERIYPASVVKMFYLVMAHRLMEDGKLKETDELRRALKDMIVDSSNDATSHVLDEITGTTSGPELKGAELKKWAEKRNIVNRYFASLGYTNINVNQKTYCEGPYGREQLFRGSKGENRNKLTTEATARLLAEIATGRAVTPRRSKMMMELMKRDYSGKSTDPDDQAHGFTGIALEPGARLWSKAGWTSTTRHDAAYIELPNGARFVLVTFTTDHSNEREIIPEVARVVISRMSKLCTFIQERPHHSSLLFSPTEYLCKSKTGEICRKPLTACCIVGVVDVLPAPCNISRNRTAYST